MKYDMKYITNISMEDISSMNKKELYELVKQSSEKYKERLYNLKKKLKEYGLPTPSILKEWGNLAVSTQKKLTKYNIVNKNTKHIDYSRLKVSPKENDSVNALRYKFKFIQDFLKSKTSLPSGWKKTMDNFYERLGGTKKLGKINYKRLWDIYQKVKQQKTMTNFDSTQIQKIIYELSVDKKLSMSKIEEMLTSNSKIDLDMELEELGYYDGGSNI